MNKKSLLKRLLSGIIAAAVTASLAFTGSVFAANTAGEGASFEDLSQNEIVEAMAPAWNLGNQLEAVSGNKASETAWGNPVITQETLKMVKDAGFKAVRIPVSYFARIGAAPNYTIEADWLKRIKEVVDMAMAEGLYAIINMHGDGYTSMVNNGAWLLCNAPADEQPAIKAKYEACWKQIATTFKDYDEHLIFESMNEEFDGGYSGPQLEYYQNINAYNQIFVDTVRKTSENNSKRWLLVPGWNTDIGYTTGNYGFEIPTDTNRASSIPADEQRIMISVHYYNPWDFCGEGKFNKIEWGTEAEVKTLQDLFTNCYNKFVAKGYPVIIGETGAVDQDNLDSRVKFYSEVCKAARSRGMVPVVWDNNGHGTGPDKFGLFNRSTFEVTQPEIIDAIMKAYEGDPLPFVPSVPYTKDDALGIIYSTKKKDATLLAAGTAGDDLAGATQVKVTFDCAPDVSFNQYANLNIITDDKGNEVSIPGDSDVVGALGLTVTADLKSALKSGDKYSISAYTSSWTDASDYVFLVGKLEFLDANGNVLKTIDKNSLPVGIMGDLNGDGEVTTADVGIINSYAKHVAEPTGDELRLADMDGSGDISTADVGIANSIAVEGAKG